MRGWVKLGGLVVSLVVALAAGLVASTGAQGICLRTISDVGCGPRPTPPEINISVKPTKLPRVGTAPIGVEAKGNLHPGDPAGMSALREAVIQVDRHLTLDAEGLPSCEARRLVAADSGEARGVCREAVVGRGTASVVLAPEWIEMEAPVTLFNGGVRDGTTTLLVHSTLNAGISEVILGRVKVRERRVGHYGSEAVVRVPPIAGGSGSVRSFSFQLHRRFAHEDEERSYLQARCPDGRLMHRVTKLVLKNEVNTPSVAPTTELTGTVLTPCTPTGSAGS